MSDFVLTGHQEWLDNVWNRIKAKLAKTSRSIGAIMPYTTKNGKYMPYPNPDANAGCWWTEGFWPGILWIMYNETGDEFYRETAEQIEEKMDEFLYAFDCLHHDVGFMWLLTSVANYRITGNDRSRRRGMTAASLLASRYNIGGGFIRAWNGGNKGWAIIDCMMNIPILYWASEQIDDKRFEKIARAHADKALEVFLRSDGSVNHIVSMDSDTGEVIETFGGQGCYNGSSWSRGQSWALYGFVLSYIRSGDVNYLDAAKRVAHYFLADLALKGDFVPDCDLRQPKDKILKDSTAGAIAACGLIEIGRCVDEHEKDLYLTGAINILKALDEQCWVKDEDNEALLTGGTSSYHGADEHNIPLIYGDYYFVEAISKLKDHKMLLW